MKVLFISPKDPDEPQKYRHLMGGENTYTRMLLENTPVGVGFIHYEEALSKQVISYHWLYYVLVWLQKFRLLPPGPRAQVLYLHDDFDLVYTHAYPVKIVGQNIPIIISDSSSNSVFLKDYLHLHSLIFFFWQKIKTWVYTQVKIIDGETNTHRAKSFFVFSKWAKTVKNLEFGIKNCNVIYPGLSIPDSGKVVASQNDRIKILFIGIWFERKGGRTLLAVFRKLAKRFKNISLTIVGELPRDISIGSREQIAHFAFLPQKKIRKLYQTHDVLVHIPPTVEGYGMVVPEAMSYGVVPVVSDICALPEFVENKKSGFIITPSSEAALEKALETLIVNPKQLKKMSASAQNRFVKMFSLRVFQKKLKKLLIAAVS